MHHLARRAQSWTSQGGGAGFLVADHGSNFKYLGTEGQQTPPNSVGLHQSTARTICVRTSACQTQGLSPSAFKTALAAVTRT
jgi:hypothetical protein